MNSNELQITSAQYVINPVDGEKQIIKIVSRNKTIFVPISAYNRYYKAILEWVAEGNTIQEAD
tara:strand:+ start:487 stop:675 length:189 start_codon:yes stop_codon:yes gene_type:complete